MNVRMGKKGERNVYRRSEGTFKIVRIRFCGYLQRPK